MDSRKEVLNGIRHYFNLEFSDHAVKRLNSLLDEYDKSRGIESHEVASLHEKLEQFNTTIQTLKLQNKILNDKLDVSYMMRKPAVREPIKYESLTEMKKVLDAMSIVVPKFASKLTGIDIKWEGIASRNRKAELVFARCIFFREAYYTWQITNDKLLMEYLNRDRTTLLYYNPIVKKGRYAKNKGRSKLVLYRFNQADLTTLIANEAKVVAPQIVEYLVD